MKKIHEDRILYAIGETAHGSFVGWIVTKSNKIYSLTVQFNDFLESCNSNGKEYYVFENHPHRLCAGWNPGMQFSGYTIKRIRWTKQRKKEFAQFLLRR